MACVRACDGEVVLSQKGRHGVVCDAGQKRGIRSKYWRARSGRAYYPCTPPFPVETKSPLHRKKSVKLWCATVAGLAYFQALAGGMKISKRTDD